MTSKKFLKIDNVSTSDKLEATSELTVYDFKKNLYKNIPPIEKKEDIVNFINHLKEDKTGSFIIYNKELGFLSLLEHRSVASDDSLSFGDMVYNEICSLTNEILDVTTDEKNIEVWVKYEDVVYCFLVFKPTTNFYYE